MTQTALTPEQKTAYNSWCAMLVKGWEEDRRWSALIKDADKAGIPLSELPTTIPASETVSPRQPVAAVIAQRFPNLSRKLFNASDKAERAMVLLWLMQNPQQPKPASTRKPVARHGITIRHTAPAE